MGKEGFEFTKWDESMDVPKDAVPTVKPVGTPTRKSPMSKASNEPTLHDGPIIPDVASPRGVKAVESLHRGNRELSQDEVAEMILGGKNPGVSEYTPREVLSTDASENNAEDILAGADAIIVNEGKEKILDENRARIKAKAPNNITISTAGGRVTGGAERTVTSGASRMGVTEEDRARIMGKPVEQKPQKGGFLNTVRSFFK